MWNAERQKTWCKIVWEEQEQEESKGRTVEQKATTDFEFIKLTSYIWHKQELERTS